MVCVKVRRGRWDGETRQTGEQRADHSLFARGGLGLNQSARMRKSLRRVDATMFGPSCDDQQEDGNRRE